MEFIRFAKWAKKTNVLFHLEANGNNIATYGTYHGEIKAYDVVIDTVHTLDSRPLIMGKAEVSKGYITLTDNLLNGIRDLKQYTITYKVFVSGIKDNAVIYPFSACVYDNESHDYIFENCKPIHEFRLEKNLFCYKTSHYMAGMLKKNAFPQNEWVFVTLSVDCTKTNQTQMRLYINGELMSLGYATTSEESNLENDIWEISRGLQNRIELPGLANCNYYALAEFTIYKGCVNHVQSFRPPEMSTHRMLNLTANSVISELELYKPTAFVDSDDEGKFKPNFGTIKEVEIPVSYDRQMTKIAYIGDEWSKGKWTEIVSDLCSMETVVREFTYGASSQDILSTLNNSLNKKPDIVVIICGYYDEDVKSAMNSIKSIVETAYNNHIIPIIVGYTRTHEKVKYLNELHKALTEYWYSSDRPPVFYYVNTYSREDLNFNIDSESHDLDDLHLSDIGEFNYASLIVETIEQAVHYEKYYRYPRSGYLDIRAMMSVTIHDIPETRLIDCRMDVYKDIVKTSRTINQLTIPWPYPLFKDDTPFMLLDKNGKLIPDKDYTISANKNSLRLVNSYTLVDGESFKFIFVHKHGLCNVKKIEISYALSSTRTYKFNSPFNEVVDLKERVQVYINSELLDKSNYTFNNRTGIMTLSSGATSGTLTMICFYSPNITNDRVVPYLAESGYIEFARSNIDRVWDKDLFAVFVNGKLVNKSKVKDMNSYTHKITEDIQSRYGLEVLNMSPIVPDLVPFLKMNHNESYYYNIKGQEVYCTMNVIHPGIYHPRNYMVQSTFSPILDMKDEYYITLLHKKTTKDINYSLKFFFDCYQETPWQVSVLGQVRLHGNSEEFDEDREDNLLICKLPLALEKVDEDEPLFSIQASDIYEVDNTEGDGIVIRFELFKQLTDRWTKLYYELTTDDYEHGTEVYLLEWVISTEENAQGKILYRKSIGFTSYETPNFIE